MKNTANPLKNPLLAGLLAAICQALWGIVFPIIKKCYVLFSIGDVPSTFVFAGIRFSLAGIVLLVIYAIQNKKFPTLDKKSAQVVTLLGTLQTGFVYGFQFMALVKASSINCSIINGSAGMFATIFAAILYKDEKITLKKAAGLILGFGGVLFCVLYRGSGVEAISFLGEGFMLFSVLFFNFSSSFSKKFTKTMSPVLTSGYNLLIGGLELLLLGLLFGGRLSSGGALGWMLLLFLAGISSFCLLLWTALFAHNGVARIAVFQGVNPIAGAIAAALILGENVFQTKYIVATLMVVTGILIINVAPKKKA